MVDLPEPFWPTRANAVPAGTSKEGSHNAQKSS